MASPVSLTRQGRIGVITVDHPPVNALNAAVRDGLYACLQQALADGEMGAIVLLGAGRTFIAGADINEFADFEKAGGKDLNEVNAAYEASAKPVIAAIHGTALGGGLEVALSCHYRCAVPSAQVGLPEVKLGLLPGAGGTQRLPRLVGAEAALDMIVRGRFVRAPKAKEMGILDELLEGELLPGAVAYAERLLAEGAPLRTIRDLPFTADKSVFDGFRKSIAREARGFFAPWKCVECVEIASRTTFEEGLRQEGTLFRQCLSSPESKAQIHIFFGEREVAKIPDIPKDTPVQEIRSAAVIGAGTMGGGIAMNFANAGVPVLVLEANEAALDRGLSTVRRNYQNTVDKGRLAQAEMDKRMALLRPTMRYEEIADVDIVIEAVFEDLEIKQEVFRKLDSAVREGAILATNTSTLDIDRIAEVTGRPQKVVGMHFFSPANVMRLLEVVRGGQSDKTTLTTAMALGRRMGKIAVMVGNCDGFVGNRMLAPYMREAEFLLEEGATPEQVDKVFYDFGMAMGPFTMGDMAGVDVGYLVEQRRRRSRPNDLRTSYLVDKLMAQERKGQKTGAGWYRYEQGDRTPRPDPEVRKLIEEASREAGVQRREISDEEILKRCLYPLINEGARCLEEGMALRPVDIDVIYTAGYGFPVYRGGPMFYADQVGLRAIHEDLQRFRERHGGWWQISPLLEELAAAGKGFADWRP